MSSFFIDRGYPVDMVESAAKLSARVTRVDALRRSKKKESSRVPLVLTYNEPNARLASTIKNNFKLLSNDSSTSHIFSEPPITAFRKDRSLRSTLVHSNLTRFQPEDNELDSGPCLRPRCKTCARLSTDRIISGPKGNFTVQDGFTCTTENVIYAIRCK